MYCCLLSFTFFCIYLDKDLPARYSVDNINDESKRSNCYNEQNLSNVVYPSSDMKYNSFS